MYVQCPESYCRLLLSQAQGSLAFSNSAFSLQGAYRGLYCVDRASGKLQHNKFCSSCPMIFSLWHGSSKPVVTTLTNFGFYQISLKFHTNFLKKIIFKFILKTIFPKSHPSYTEMRFNNFDVLRAFSLCLNVTKSLLVCNIACGLLKGEKPILSVIV